MSKSKEHIKRELEYLYEYGNMILIDEAIKYKKIPKETENIIKNKPSYQEYKNKNLSLLSSYQDWFTKSYNIVRQILPDRHQEFYDLYKTEKRKSIDSLTYTISDYFLGLVVKKGSEEIVDRISIFSSKMYIQISILEACLKLIDSKLENIEELLQYELFENELQAAQNLLNKKYIRAAGVLAGVTLETHLLKVCKFHNIIFRKQNPTISDFNEELKKLEIIDLPTWRLIQRLGDIRNMSAHSKEREPTPDEVMDLIRGVEKLISEIN